VRENILQEILSTEKSYIESMQLIIEFWKVPMMDFLQNNSQVIKESQINTMFYLVPELIELALSLLEKFSERIKDKEEPKLIGDIFLEYVPKMRLYTNFVLNFDDSMEDYQRLNSNQEFSNFQRQCMRNANTKLDLPSYLIMPVQRIPRYELLIRDLLKKKTDESHPDHHNLEDAIKEVRELNLFINQAKKTEDNKKKIILLQSAIHSTAPIILYKEDRILVSEGTLSAEMRKGKKKGCKIISFQRYNSIVSMERKEKFSSICSKYSILSITRRNY